ncbi:MAG: OPT/YSL family transporter [Candidatus Babeliales bacterium]
MSPLVLILGIVFTLFSVITLSYVSMATMVGPWIAPTLVLLGNCFYRLRPAKNAAQQTEEIALMQAIGAGGGIIATGIGFALPMLYFLDEKAFTELLAQPWYFCGFLAILCLVAGGLGLWFGRWVGPSFLDTQSYQFPVSALTYRTITAHTQPLLAKKFMWGSLGTIVMCFFRDGFWRCGGLISKTYHALPSLFGTSIAISIWPTLWAIGFSVGTSVALPLFVGLIAKYVVAYPLAHHALWANFSLFPPMSVDTFSVAFCSGLILSELLVSLPGYAKKLGLWLRAFPQTSTQHFLPLTIAGKKSHLIELGIICFSAVLLLSYFSMSLLAQVGLVIFTLVATRAICQIAGKIGMLPFGRFSTFIVIPLLLIFKLNALQATIVCVFFDICAATASDLLFDYKIGDLCTIDRKKIYRYQWIGLVVTALSIGVILWLLFTHFQLGSEALFAQRGKAKALLLQSLHFDKYIVFLGVLFGWVLKYAKLSPTMVFGGLIMPNSISIGLILGGLATKLVKNPENAQPFCAGILAVESIWTLLTIATKTL